MFYTMNSIGNNYYKYVVKNLSFTGYHESVCENCGRNITIMTYSKQDNYELLLEGGRRYPDLLQFCGAGDSLLLLSERALTIFKQENVSGISEYEPVVIVENEKDNRIKNEENIPRYFRIKLSGSIDFDYSTMFLKRKKYCASCRQFELNRHRLQPYYIDRKTWNGCDLCSLITFPFFAVCTEKIVKIVKANKLTNFEFKKMAEVDENVYQN